MWGRRIAYLLILAVCFLNYLIFGIWFSAVLLLAVLLLPIVSLLLSLPALFTVQVAFHMPSQGRVHVPARTSLQVTCKFPAPAVRCKIRIINKLTGQRYVGRPGEYLPVEHCGHLEVHVIHLWAMDYLGLFRRDVKPNQIYTMTVLPKPVPENLTLTGDEGFGQRWKPKAGGFAENHELRLYRPGDDLRLLHFKMSAKTRKLIYREPVVQEQMRVCLAVTLSGTPAELDHKLGRLFWLSQELLKSHVGHEVRCCSDLGDHSYRITDPDSQLAVFRSILASPVTVGEWEPEDVEADRLYKIGGEA